MSSVEEEVEYNILLPLDIQVEILKKLPTKSLIQFRSVSKEWKSFIDSSHFILSYGVRHANRFILRYEYEGYLYEGDLNTFTLIDNDNENCDTFSNQCVAPVDPPGLVKCSDHLYHPKVVGSSHGLLCLGDFFQPSPTGGIIDIVILWNPSIRRSVGIQLPRILDWIARFGPDFMDYLPSYIVGFGVCPVTVDPTIVIINHGESKSNYRSLRYMALVFTLTSGTWNILSTNLPPESIIILNPHVVIGGFIYWVAFEKIDEDDRFYKLVSFDLTAKEFRVINLPDRLTLNRPRISNLRGSLVVLEQTVSSCFLWMMTMKGVTPSFTRLYAINQPVTNLLGFRNTGEPIVGMPVHDERYVTLHVYDPRSQHSHSLCIDGDMYFFFMCPYMETLLLLDQPDGYTYSISN